MEQVITQLAVKILFEDYSGYYVMRRTLFYQRSRNNNRLYMYMTKVQELNNHQYLRFRHQMLETS